MSKNLFFAGLFASIIGFWYFYCPIISSPPFLGGVIYLKSEGGKTTEVKISDCRSIFSLIQKIRKIYPMIMPPFPERKNKIVTLLFIGRDSHERYEMDILIASGAKLIANITEPSHSPYVSTTSYYSLDEEGKEFIRRDLLEVFSAGKSKDDGTVLSEIERLF
ncbi:MAG: hypothetical protein WA705_00605 [Candidatus Ozemobacteraceae bacterium]